MFQSKEEKYHHLRSATRFNTDGFTCRDGALADLSGTGMRLQFEGRPPFKVGDSKDFLITGSGKTIRVPGVVVWVKRATLFGRAYEAGIHFSSLRKELQQAIGNFAKHGVLMTGGSGTVFSSGGTGGGQKKKKIRVTVDGADHYAMLGVPRSSTEDQIHEAYRQLAKRLHPDMNKEPDAADRFKGISEAYRVLKDEHLRTQYDLSNAA